MVFLTCWVRRQLSVRSYISNRRFEVSLGYVSLRVPRRASGLAVGHRTQVDDVEAVVHRRHLVFVGEVGIAER